MQHVFRRGAVAFALLAVLSVIPALAWADNAVKVEPDADATPQMGQAYVADAADDGISVMQVPNRVEKSTITAYVEGRYSQSNARDMLGYINAARAQAGAPALSWSYELENCAMKRAAEISYLFSHDRPSGEDFDTVIGDVLGKKSMYFTYLGENILEGTTDVATANAWWSGSPGHYGNMIDKGFNVVGVACFDDCWVEIFGYQTSNTGPVGVTDGRDRVLFEVGQEYLYGVFYDFEADAWYSDYIIYMLNNGFMRGYNDGSHLLGTYDSIKRGDVATILWRMAGCPVVYCDDFYDVPEDSYYYYAIAWARAQGIVGGYTAPDGSQLNLFGPEDTVTREQFAVMIYNYAKDYDRSNGGVDLSSNGSKLNSMPDAGSVSSWAKEALAWALDKGVMDGQEIDGVRYVNPQGSAWRAAVAKMAVSLERNVL